MSETQNKLLKAAISLAAAGVVFFLPFASWGIQLSPIEIRVIAMFVMAALFWILEPIPIWSRSTCLMNRAWWKFRPPSPAPASPA